MQGSRLPRFKTQLSEVVTDHIRNMILSGQLVPGTSIRLDDTARSLGVSVTPVREALLSLQGEGWVSLMPRRGYKVNELNEEDISDLYSLAQFLSTEICRRAAPNLTAADIAALRGFTSGLEVAMAVGDIDRVVDNEFQFHRLINIRSKRHKLVWFREKVASYAPVDVFAHSSRWGEASVSSHRKLIDAMACSDLGGIEEANRKQFEASTEVLVAHLKAVGALVGPA
ncbi:HTH-type transcriptional regulator McbR [Corynebacterium hansenii]|nr:HTH-type transcriptional regulator McbR [Corynebacterium hansenii]